MKRFNLQFIFFLLLSGCATKGSVISNGEIEKTIPSMKNHINQIYYTQKNIWFDDNRESNFKNHHVGKRLPINSKVIILIVTKNVIKLKVDNTQYTISCLEKDNCHSIEKYFNQYFQSQEIIKQSDYQKLSNSDKDAIHQGILINGMSKKAVLMSFGIPEKEKNYADIWFYILNSHLNNKITFRNNKIYAIKNINMTERVTQKCISNCPDTTIAVYPFKNNTSKKENNWISLGIPELMTSALSQINNVSIIERSNLQEILKENTLKLSGITGSNVPNIGKLLGASHLIIGSYTVLNDIITVTARLIETTTGKILKSESDKGKISKLNILIAQISLKLSGVMGYELTKEEKDKIKQNSITMMKTLEALSRGLLSRESGNIKAAKEYYIEALAHNPSNKKEILAIIKDLDIKLKSIGISRFHNNNIQNNKIQNNKYDYLSLSIPESLTDVIIHHSGLPLTERLNIDKALDELGLGQTGVIDPRSAVPIGKMSGANYLIIGSFEVINENINIHSRIINTKNGQILISKNKTGNLNKISTLQRSLALGLIKNLQKIKKLDGFVGDIEGNPTEVNLVLGDSLVGFDLGQAQLKPSSFPILNDVANILKEHTQYRIQIRGHTDNIGAKDFNERLSRKRAVVVLDYMIRHGISANRLSYIGFGETSPIADNDTEEGRARNRRVEFRMVR